jgi:hypothetical protein
MIVVVSETDARNPKRARVKGWADWFMVTLKL